MGFRENVAFEYSNKVKQKVLVSMVVFLLFIKPSSTLTTRFSLIDFLAGVPQDEVFDFVQYVQERLLPPYVEAGLSLLPGVVNVISAQFSNGFRMMIRLTAWNDITCNLGLGSENIYPRGRNRVQANVLIQVTPVLWELIVEMIHENCGYGEVTQQGVGIDFCAWSPDQVGSGGNPADGGHQVPLELEQLANSTHQSVGNAHRNSSESSFPLYYRPPPGGRLRLATNVTSSKTSFQKKFPVNPDGDCDISSTSLMTSMGPFYDDQSTHGIQLLNPTDKIWSPRARFSLVMQLDCNLVLYDTDSNTALWASGTNGRASTCYATISRLGNVFVVDEASNQVLWSTNTGCTDFDGYCWTNTILQVQDDGNLVLYKEEQVIDREKSEWILEILWASNTVQCEGGC